MQTNNSPAIKATFHSFIFIVKKRKCGLLLFVLVFFSLTSFTEMRWNNDIN